jgi:hypothetical protein
MQVVGVVTGDEFLLNYNLTLDAENLLYYLSLLGVSWFDDGLSNYANFDDFYGIDFAVFLGPGGFCYNFNMMETDELFNLDM